MTQTLDISNQKGKKASYSPTLQMELKILGTLCHYSGLVWKASKIVYPHMFIALKEEAQLIFDHCNSGEAFDVQFLSTKIPPKRAFYIARYSDKIGFEKACHSLKEAFLKTAHEKMIVEAATQITKGEDYRLVFSKLNEQRELALMQGSKNEAILIKNKINSTLDEIYRATEVQGLTGVDTGYEDLNEVTGGWQPTDQVLIAARPGMGKTFYMLNLALASALSGKGVLIVSVEMSTEQLIKRLIMIVSGISTEKMRNGNLTESEKQVIQSTAETIGDLPIYIVDDMAYVEEIEAVIYEHSQDISLYMVDYIQLIGSMDKNLKTRNDIVGKVSWRFKTLNKKTKLTSIVLSQLSRAVETRGGSKRPLMSDLRDSGSLEQDADIIQFLYRPSYYKIYEDEDGNNIENITEIDQVKNRHGRVMTFKREVADGKFEMVQKQSSFQPLSSNKSNTEEIQTTGFDDIPF